MTFIIATVDWYLMRSEPAENIEGWRGRVGENWFEELRYL
jgi:hypothetical protein